MTKETVIQNNVTLSYMKARDDEIHVRVQGLFGKTDFVRSDPGSKTIVNVSGRHRQLIEETLTTKPFHKNNRNNSACFTVDANEIIDILHALCVAKI